MPVARNPGSTSLVDILDRVLDQGIHFAQGHGAALAKPPAPAQGGRIVVEAVETYFERPGLPPGKTSTGA